ncbi:MAG: LacI family DNA-binding transcriptional regulator [Pseudomonadota bacterium]
MRRRRKLDDDPAATLEDVARAAGVSVATVSRALNFPDLVREATKARVAEAIEKTRYTPHFAARALATNRTHTVGAIIPTLNNAIFARGVNAFEETLRGRGFTLLLSVSNYDAATEHLNALRMIERGVDAVMLIGIDHGAETLARLSAANTPLVCTWSHAPDHPAPTVGFDNHAAMAPVVAHLIAHGHRRIAMLAGITEGNDRARARVAGVRDALRQSGLSLAALREVRYGVEEAAAAATALLCEEAPTAIICGNDVIAHGALFAAHRLGHDVPGAVSIVGFDDLPLSAAMPPGLTTVRVPAARMGRLAAEHLVSQIEGTIAPSRALPTELVVRGTTGPARPQKA